MFWRVFHYKKISRQWWQSTPQVKNIQPSTGSESSACCGSFLGTPVSWPVSLILVCIILDLVFIYKGLTNSRVLYRVHRPTSLPWIGALIPLLAACAAKRGISWEVVNIQLSCRVLSSPATSVNMPLGLVHITAGGVPAPPTTHSQNVLLFKNAWGCH